MLLTLGAHARGLQYLVCLSVCVCFPYSGTSRNQAYKQQYQRVQCDTGMKYKKGFFLKRFVPKLWRHLLTVTVPGDIQAPLSLLFQRRSILKLFKWLTVGYALIFVHALCARGIPRERHGYTDVMFAPPTYCQLLASSTHFIIMPGLNARGLQSKLLITPLSE